MAPKTKIKTKRLLLRFPTSKDASAITENIKDFDVIRFTAHVPHPYSIKDAKQYIRYCRKQIAQQPILSYDFAIEHRKEKKVIGGSGLMKIDSFTGKADIGYWLGKKYWRQGYGSEAVEAIIKFAFGKLGLQRLEAPIYKENIASQALVKKLGFKKEGIRRRASKSRATGVMHDVMIFALLKFDAE
jgi:RimJ/RimL family protein N-acetyltransferase